MLIEQTSDTHRASIRSYSTSRDTGAKRADEVYAAG